MSPGPPCLLVILSVVGYALWIRQRWSVALSTGPAIVVAATVLLLYVSDYVGFMRYLSTLLSLGGVALFVWCVRALWRGTARALSRDKVYPSSYSRGSWPSSGSTLGTPPSANGTRSRTGDGDQAHRPCQHVQPHAGWDRSIRPRLRPGDGSVGLSLPPTRGLLRAHKSSSPTVSWPLCASSLCWASLRGGERSSPSSLLLRACWGSWPSVVIGVRS